MKAHLAKTPLSEMPSSDQHVVANREDGASRWRQFWCIIAAAILIAAIISHFVASWFGLQTDKPTFRRIGPESGPQVFLAGSSLLQFGLSWPDVSAALGQGIECWAIGGSSPEVWEVFQRGPTTSNLMIIGFSAYDLNEEHLSDHRADNVPLMQTIQDLVRMRTDLQASKRILSQYPLSWMRTLFPTAGQSDAVLVGVRRKLFESAGLSPTAEENANAMVLPKQPVLDFGGSTDKLSEWPLDKRLRRLTLIQNEIHGVHRFDGLQKAALLRMLSYAQERGRIIVAVMPVAPAYAHEFLDKDSLRRFEQTLNDAKNTAPQMSLVRLDQLAALQSDEYYSDFIHLNGEGRRIATGAFLKQIREELHLR